MGQEHLLEGDGVAKVMSGVWSMDWVWVGGADIWTVITEPGLLLGCYTYTLIEMACLIHINICTNRTWNLLMVFVIVNMVPIAIFSYVYHS